MSKQNFAGKQNKLSAKSFHHHHRIVPIACITFGIPVFLVVLWLLGGALFTHDEKLASDQDLLVPSRNINESENSFSLIRDVSDTLSKKIPPTSAYLEDPVLEAMLRGESWDEQHATELLTTYHTEIEMLLQAAEMPYYQDPATAEPAAITPDTFPYANIGSTRDLSKLAALQAQSKARQGDPQSAINIAVEIIALGHKMEQGNDFLIQYLVASSVKQIGLAALRQIATIAPVDFLLAQSTITTLEQYRDSTAGAVTAVKLEHTVRANYREKLGRLDQMFNLYYAGFDEQGNPIESPSTWLVRAIDRSGVLRYYYRPNQTWNLVVHLDRRNAQLAGAPCATLDRNPAQEKILKRYGLALLVEPNAIGKLYVDIGNVSLGSFATKRCDESVATSATQAMLALSSYKKDHDGQLPTSLTELVPAYFPTIPADPYDGGSIKYSTEKKIVYSVGSDHTDNGGNSVSDPELYRNTSNPWQSMIDPAFSLEE